MTCRIPRLLLPGLLLAVASCGAAAAALPAAVDALVARAREQVTLIDQAAFLAVLQRADVQAGGILVIDVREPDEFEAGHIPGAVNIPRGVIEFRIWSLLGDSAAAAPVTAVYLYCGWGSRAALAAQSLQQLGLAHVTAVDVQLAQWQADGLPFALP
ncbi:MAG: rhodanese-like domain-containing protein [Pseudomonadota bacterium]